MMENLNRPIEMIACCSVLGEMTPIKFRMENEAHQLVVASISEILYTKESHIAGMETMEYGCKIKVEEKEALVEVSYHIHTHKWLMKRAIG